MASVLTKLVQQRSQYDYARFSQDSIAWIRKKVDNLRNSAQIARDISREAGRTGFGNRFKLGGMYFYYYDAKYKEELPYWDRFPLVIPLQMMGGEGFLGLNVHYLPPALRATFMDKLLDYAVLTPQNEVARIRITYDILNATKNLREFRPCLKHYLWDHVASKIITVEPNEWEVAVFLPVAQFGGTNKNKVYADSLKEIKRQANNKENADTYKKDVE